MIRRHLRAIAERRARMSTLVVVVVIGLGLAGAALLPVDAVGAAGNGSAPELKNPARTAEKLVTSWLTALQDEDAAEIAAFLAPNFQIERADGSGTDRAGYLVKPPVVTEFTLGDEVTALQSGNTLTARWSVKVSEEIGDNEFRDVVAPRLTTFVWRNGRWKILSYANFNPIQ